MKISKTKFLSNTFRKEKVSKSVWFIEPEVKKEIERPNYIERSDTDSLSSKETVESLDGQINKDSQSSRKYRDNLNKETDYSRQKTIATQFSYINAIANTVDSDN